MRLLSLAVLLALAVLGAAPGSAQPAEAATSAPAEASFERGLVRYESGDYEAAATWFLQAATEYGYTTTTTAAYLMAGKAHYAAGHFPEAMGVFTTFVNQFPRSRYAPEAQRLLEASVRGNRTEPSGPFHLGIMLPVGERDLNFSQALFNGIRLAVDEHNAANPATPVRMVFRDSQGSSDGARVALGLLASQDVGAVIGPLYSAEALDAAEAAERRRLPLLAPMATDEAVTEGRRYAFQFNPTPTTRARTMARYALDGLGARTLGVVAEQDGTGGRMAPVFDATATRLGATVPVYDLLGDRRDWFSLTQRLPGSDLSSLDVLYVPLDSRDADQTMRNVVRNLDQAGALGRDGPGLRLLGNGVWHTMNEIERASPYGLAYTLDFVPDSARPGGREFAERYRVLSGGVDPDRLAYTGYDTARFLLARLASLPSTEDAPRDALANALRGAGPYQGLGIRIDLAGGQSNQALYLVEVRDGQRLLVE
ncbi:MAG: ABC transporter substrate-binding protein [Bacteroidota bacterium]